MLKNDAIPSRKRRSCEAKQLPEWIIPRHDREHDAKRLKFNSACGRSTLDNLRCEISGRSFSIMITIVSAFFDFSF